MQKERIPAIIRNCLFGWMNKQFLIFLFFLAFSGVFWLMMALNETYEREFCIPVSLVGVPKNVVLTTDIPDTIRVTLRDKGYTLSTYLYSDRIKPLRVSFPNYTGKTTGYGLVPAADVQKMVYQSINSSSKIVSVKPDKLDFYYNYGLSKTVPVRMVGSVIPGKNYYLARTSIKPDKVTVYAGKQLLDSIVSVKTEALRVANFEDTVVREVKLQSVRGMKAVPSKVSITLYPDILTEESIEVPIKAINMPEDKVLRTFPSHVKVRFIVGASMFRNVKPEQFSAVVDYNEIAGNTSSKCSIYLRTAPHTVRNARLEMNQVDFLIEQ
ncbi:MAG: CdaR family protein [Prevotella sp.]